MLLPFCQVRQKFAALKKAKEGKKGPSTFSWLLGTRYSLWNWIVAFLGIEERLAYSQKQKKNKKRKKDKSNSQEGQNKYSDAESEGDEVQHKRAKTVDTSDALDDEQAMMAKMMGFSGFSESNNKK